MPLILFHYRCGDGGARQTQMKNISAMQIQRRCWVRDGHWWRCRCGVVEMLFDAKAKNVMGKVSRHLPRLQGVTNSYAEMEAGVLQNSKLLALVSKYMPSRGLEFVIITYCSAVIFSLGHLNNSSEEYDSL
eukprot:scaffold2037_cov87-Skeletonema_dohrnii-CCMP3373.AAC.10